MQNNNEMEMQAVEQELNLLIELTLKMEKEVNAMALEE